MLNNDHLTVNTSRKYKKFYFVKQNLHPLRIFLVINLNQCVCVVNTKVTPFTWVKDFKSFTKSKPSTSLYN